VLSGRCNCNGSRPECHETQQRCLFASNFPIDRLAADYDTIWALFRDAVSTLSTDEQHAVLRGNAERIYRI